MPTHELPKGPLWGLRPFLTIESPLKMIKNALYFMLTLLLEILGNMCIVTICYPVCDVINFEINHSFLIKRFFHINKKLKKILT